ncbi:MAG: restriction endonuclease subunit S [Staphylococcus equorum]
MTNEIKNMPELRFSGFSEEWKKKKLEEIAYINDGTHMTPNYVQAGIPFFSVENVTRNDFVNSKFVTEEAYEKYKKRIDIEYNDILMTRIGSIGKVKLVNWIHSTTFYVSLALLKIHEGFVPQYISYLLESFKVQKSIMSNSLVTAVPQKINLIDLKKVDIVLTISINEQQRIGDFFSKLDRQIELEEQKLAKLEEQKKGYMQQIFSQQLRFKDECGNDYPNWETKKLEDVANYRRGSFPQPYGNKEWYDDISGEPFVQVYDVDSNMKLNKETKQKISEKAKPKSVKGFKDDIVVTLQGSIGRVAILQYDAYIDRTLLLINSFKFPVNKGYFKYILYLLFLREKERAPGGTIKTITKSVLSNFKIQIPALEEQEKIGNFFGKIDDSIEKQSSKIGVLKQRKKGFLQKMFV